jgi:hypothetical protein
VLPEKEAKALIEANRLLRRIQGFLRLSAGTDFTEKGAPEGQKAALARACGVDDFAGVRRAMKTAVKTGKKAYETHIAEPARNSAEDT